MAVRPVFLGVIGAVFAAEAGAAEAPPLSAIDWLSNSVALPEGQSAPAAEEPQAMLPDAVTVLPLDVPLADAAGIMPASDLGLDAGLWGRSSAAELARSLGRMPEGADTPPSLRRFLSALLQAGFEPPIDAAVDDTFFLARIDWLLSHGYLEPAAALIDMAGQAEPRRFRRAFDIALLSGTETEACRQIVEAPDTSTYPARIFCQARLGQWEVAALTLGNAEALGILTPEEDQLLLHFLDPELFEGEPIPAPPRVPSPLLFRLYEAVGERQATDAMPLAYAWADISETVGWKARLRAAERLTAGGAMAFKDLASIMQEREPAASGGVFDRAAAIQDYIDAPGARTLQEAWHAAHVGGYSAEFARWVTGSLDTSLDGSAKHDAFEIALLAGRYDLAARFAEKQGKEPFLVALANGTGAAPLADDVLSRAVVRGLAAIGPGPAYRALIEDDRKGEALLRALQQLMDGAAGNPRATSQSLALLRKLGLEGLARQVAVELILIEGAA